MVLASGWMISWLWLWQLCVTLLATTSRADGADSTTSAFWMASIARQGAVAYGDANHTIFRNVRDFGAKGDGVTDDSNAINSAITAGQRCGQGCDSTTITPAIVYFPPGVYAISQPLIQLYYTQFIGDPTNLPIIKGMPSFGGIALIDADPYLPDGSNWYTNQNNFFRQVRNFVLDTTQMPPAAGTGIHWQVAQATSLQNIVFNMRTDEGNAHQGIFIDNGSGGFMTDLIFNGGKYGAFMGSQQFTSRNMTFNGCQTAIYMNWNWAWTFHGLTINNAQVGINMSGVGEDGVSQTVGSVIILDSQISNTPVGVLTKYSTAQNDTRGTLVLENVDMRNNVPQAVSDAAGTSLPGNTVIASYLQGRAYASGAGSGQAIQSAVEQVKMPQSLLDPSGRVYARSKPQYESLSVSSFKSVKAAGAKGDGITDDTQAIQNILNSAGPDDIVYFDHGAYVISSTVKVPKDIKITGEIWPLIMANGAAFSDQQNPQPVFQVGQPGDVGSVEISDLMFETIGPQAGAIMIEWNVAEAAQGSSGMWDTHIRIGGSAGTRLQSDKCKKDPATIAGPNPECIGAFLLLHVTQKATIYLENNWFWVADHELDLKDYSQINLYNGRGVLVESDVGPVWMYGTSAEHNVLYNYQIANASQVFMGLIQTETPYFQSNPDATVPFSSNPKYFDPVFTGDAATNKAWGLRITGGDDIFVYGAGLYSFFENYAQQCVADQDCQANMVSLESVGNVNLYGLSTKAAVNMVTVGGQSAALDRDNRNNFCATIAYFRGDDASCPPGMVTQPGP